MSICLRIPKLSRCCGCINLRIGGFIIAGLSIVIGVLKIVGNVSALVLYENQRQLRIDNYELVYAIAVSSACLEGLQVLLSLFLLLGIILNRHSWLLPYLWVSAVVIGVVLVYNIVVIFYIWLFGIPAVLGSLISVYFWMCIQSLYQDMRGQPK